jgi:hypothetical protein
MTKININDKVYDTETMDDNAKPIVVSLQFVQAELRRLEAQIAVYKTAEKAYAITLKEILENS